MNLTYAAVFFCGLIAGCFLQIVLIAALWASDKWRDTWGD